MQPIVLTIAGSDPSGGAGIQTDQRVIESLGCATISVISALTSQNTLGVAAVYSVPPDVFRSQLTTLLSDIRPDAIKIGLLPSAEHVQIVAEAVRKCGLKNIVLDPVLAPTVGEVFLDAEGIEVLESLLLPLCDLITPNAPEASKLAGIPIHSIDDFTPAAESIILSGARAVLVKGGHIPDLDGTIIDVLVTASGSTSFQANRVETQDIHGTGCTLSSAIASHLALGYSLVESISASKRLLTHALKSPVILGSGRGHPAISAARSSKMHDARLKRLKGVYFVTGEHSADPDIIEMVRSVLDGGVKIVQLREKQLSTSKLIQVARSIRTLTLAYDALLIINDRVDIAHAVDADGVHLGPDDLPPSAARRLLGPDCLIGVSAGSPEEMKAYGDIRDVSYLGCGPVFGTSSKSDAGNAIGTARLVEMRALYPEPMIAIGGITLDNIADVRATGVSGAAVVSAITQASDPQAATEELVRIWNR